MTGFLAALCIILSGIVIYLLCYVISMRKAARRLSMDFAKRLSEDTNVGLDISCGDKEMRRLAAELNRQLKTLRKEHVRYAMGDRELKDAVTNMSHDLRTPLTAVCGYLDLLEKEETSDAVKEYLSIIGNRVNAMKGLTEELFRYSIVMSTESSERPEKISLNGALEECIASYYAAFVEAGITPEISMPEEVVYYTGKPQALSRILSNIVSNAIKYSDGDFQATLCEDRTMFFRNKAEGLDDVQLGRLFDRFFTVETARNSTGLGLSIAKHLTEEMGGTLSAELSDGVLCICLKLHCINNLK